MAKNAINNNKQWLLLVRYINGLLWIRNRVHLTTVHPNLPKDKLEVDVNPFLRTKCWITRWKYFYKQHLKRCDGNYF